MKNLLILAFCLLMINKNNAQVVEHECYIVQSVAPDAIGASPNGEVFTPKGDLKVLTIFAGFDDGSSQGFDEL
jgi:hypothetical protein